ncbi:MAG: hypothetical protein FWH29_10465, partial [Methanobrevibacter sp.]|nr:hypothetical protein [Methanobrevibacter sp.]
NDKKNSNIYYDMAVSNSINWFFIKGFFKYGLNGTVERYKRVKGNMLYSSQKILCDRSFQRA